MPIKKKAQLAQKKEPKPTIYDIRRNRGESPESHGRRLFEFQQERLPKDDRRTWGELKPNEQAGWAAYSNTLSRRK